MNIASIDIGSNTVILLIAKTQNGRITETILNDYRIPRISKNLTNDNNISDKKIEELFSILSDYKNQIENYSCEKVLISATAGFRKAANSQYVSDLVFTKLGLKIETIDGDLEAQYSFLGTASDLPKNKNRLIIDIGGGSTELIYGNSEKLFYKKSFPIGAVNLTEKFITAYPVSSIDESKLKLFILQTLDEIKTSIPQNCYTVAVAGTPTTLSAINQNLKDYDEEKIEMSILTSQALINLINTFRRKTPDEILSDYGKIVVGRNDVILTGSLILHTIIELLSIDKINCSGKGIRYGAVNYYLLNS